MAETIKLTDAEKAAAMIMRVDSAGKVAAAATVAGLLAHEVAGLASAYDANSPDRAKEVLHHIGTREGLQAIAAEREVAAAAEATPVPAVDPPAEQSAQ